MTRAAATGVWIAAAGALLACAGCGFKGPLYLPERNVTVVTHPAQGAPAAPPPGQTQTPDGKNKTKASAPHTGATPAAAP